LAIVAYKIGYFSLPKQ